MSLMHHNRHIGHSTARPDPPTAGPLRSARYAQVLAKMCAYHTEKRTHPPHIQAIRTNRRISVERPRDSHDISSKVHVGGFVNWWMTLHLPEPNVVHT